MSFLTVNTLHVCNHRSEVSLLGNLVNVITLLTQRIFLCESTLFEFICNAISMKAQIPIINRMHMVLSWCRYAEFKNLSYCVPSQL